MDIPERLERAVDDAVTCRLVTELGDRGLLLKADDLVAAEADSTALGRQLLAGVLERCYPAAPGLTLEFERAGDAARIGAALAFGAVTSTVLASGVGGAGRPSDLRRSLCATFNLGIGLVDGVCDGDALTGEVLLAHFRDAEVAGASGERQHRGWLRAGLPSSLAADHGVGFTVDIIEAFFDELHEEYPHGDGAQVRGIIGAQIARALEVEASSVAGPLTQLSRDRMMECSRGTSVLPFEIIETLTVGGWAATAPSAGTQLGEAMWRIDDLVDVCADARCGALNAVLVAACARGGHGHGYHVADVDGLLASSDIASAAARAADCLQAGLRDVSRADRGAFLGFVHRYAGIAPAS